MTSDRDITQLLVRWKHGDEHALVLLLPLVYRELRALARAYLRRERRDHTLQPTALVHELFLRLASDGATDWKDRAHFFGIAASAMRQILVAHARRHRAAKRGGGQQPLDIESIPNAVSTPAVDLTALDEALRALAARDERQARVVEYRFFGGYTIDETATLLGLSPATVSREWQLARVWLFREMHGSSGDTA